MVWTRSFWASLIAKICGTPLKRARFLKTFPDDKVVFFCGISWFMDYQNPAKCFRLSFSPEAYADLMANPKVSDKTKAKIQKKMVEYGVSEDEVYAEASDKTFVDRINEGVRRSW